MQFLGEQRSEWPGDVACVAHSDAGGVVLWDAAAFGSVVDYETWDSELGEEPH